MKPGWEAAFERDAAEQLATMRSTVDNPHFSRRNEALRYLEMMRPDLQLTGYIGSTEQFVVRTPEGRTARLAVQDAHPRAIRERLRYWRRRSRRVGK